MSQLSDLNGRSLPGWPAPVALALPPTAGWAQTGFVTLGMLIYFGVNFGLNPGIDTVPATSNLAYTVSQSLMLVGTAVLLARHGRQCLSQVTALAPFLVLLLFTLLSAAWSQSASASLHRSVSLGTLLAFTLYAHAVLGIARTCRIQVGAMWIAALASLVMAVAVPASGYDFGDYAQAIRGVFPQKNSLGEVMTAGILALSYLVLARGRVVWTDAATTAMSLGMTLLANSTTSLLLSGLIVGATLASLAMSRGAGWAGLFVLAAGGVGIGCGVAAALNPDMVFALLGKDMTLTGRTAIWSAIGRAAGGPSPLGYGYAAFWLPTSRATQSIWAEMNWMVPSAHSGYLDTVLELGLAGLALIVGLAALTLVAAAWAMLSGAWAAGLWAAIVLVVLALFNVDESSLPRPDIHQLQWVLAFMAATMARRGRGAATAGPR